MTNAISYPKFRAWDSNNNPLVGGKLYSYEVGTSTLANTYSDVDLSVPNSNPVILDSQGEADVYISGSVKLVLYDADDVLLWTVSEVQGSTLWTFSQFTASVLYSSVLYGGTQAAIEAALTAVGSTEATLYLAPDNWIITDTSTLTEIPSNVTLKPERGALMVIQTGQTLNINGSFEAGIYQVFDCQGTGKVIFGSMVETVYPEWFGAVKDGATDDGPAIIDACAALSATGCKRIVFSNGSYFIFESGTAYTNLGTFTNFSGLQIISDGATLAIDPANTFTAHYGAIFRLDGGNNPTVDGFNVTGPTLTLTQIQNRESVEFVRAYHGCTNINMPHNRVQGVIGGLLVSRLVDGGTPSESATYICKNINVGLLEVTNSSYGVACGHSGDNLTVGMIKGDGVGRPYFVYGAKNHKVSITAKDCKLAGFNLSAYAGGGCEDIDVTYVDTESTSAFNYRSEILWMDQTAAVFRNIRLHMNNVFGATGDTGTAILRIGKKQDDGTTDDTVDRGHILENLTISGYSTGTPSTADTALYGTLPGCEWGSSGTPDVWKNIKFKDLIVKSSTIPCSFAFGALDGDLTFENVDSPTLAWAIRKNFLVNFPVGRINVIGSNIKNLWKLTDTYYDAIMVVKLSAYATADAYTLDVKETGKLVSNEDCANLQTVTLPPAVVGLRYSFNNLGNGTNIDPDGTEVILGGGAGKYLSLAAAGDHVTLVCETDGYWQIESSYGTLAFEA